MSLKDILKQIKAYESSISTVMGFVIIVVIGLLVVNYFRNIETPKTLNEAANTELVDSSSHVIAEGESLWTIAESYYDDGFRWTDIMEANNIENPGDIEVGQKIIIPEVEAQVIANNVEEVVVEATEAPVQEPVVIATEAPAEVIEVIEEVAQDIVQIKGDTYTVVRGDNLWNIAVSAYGDGFRWTDIASANDLVNPSLIHAGNVLVIPA